MPNEQERYWPRLLLGLRARQGLTQTALAERLGVDQTTVSRWERGLDHPGPRRRRSIRDLMRGEGRHDQVMRARVRYAAWPASLVARGAVFLEINQGAATEAGLSQDLRGQSIYGRFGPRTDEVTDRWERTGIFDGELALTISLNALLDASGREVFIRTLDTPHFTSDGTIWCLCELKRIGLAEYQRLRSDYRGSTLTVPFDALV